MKKTDKPTCGEPRCPDCKVYRGGSGFRCATTLEMIDEHTHACPPRIRELAAIEELRAKKKRHATWRDDVVATLQEHDATVLPSLLDSIERVCCERKAAIERVEQAEARVRELEDAYNIVRDAYKKADRDATRSADQNMQLRKELENAKAIIKGSE